jgi:hypothetical protein
MSAGSDRRERVKSLAEGGWGGGGGRAPAAPIICNVTVEEESSPASFRTFMVTFLHWLTKGNP